ncbi:heme ABC exporter ATP-binding protein CcmA [Roseospira marina]|uniref:Heme ABC exporter ATP-binding protein CcmA n=1 Tax=Roseospira marina TaxID=140057 RepID=A0A5M6IDB0_9PROT|nr:heme ABC exporter ATP-binding protein CcmA [Roseospira marina]KAA5605608.1 heme ABC exporter ATP-binding protein CcmA [Roseospira marina]MBB4313324.1 heme exporter protein A [Roseospira marina]MBB5085935.1 heme exporter protein A [Roseospira marina]
MSAAPRSAPPPSPAHTATSRFEGGFEGRGLICIRSERIVFAHLDLALSAGEALLLLGPNGSGKSSLLRLMAGLLRPAGGKLAWHDGPVADEPERHRARTRYVGHTDAIKPVLSARENLTFWARVCAGPDDTRADLDTRVAAALDRLTLSHLADVPGRMLSAGQKRRLNLARLLAAPAPLWLMDEPTTALDVGSIAILEEILAEHRARGGMIALSTHQPVTLPEARVLNLDDYAVEQAGAWGLPGNAHPDEEMPV